MRVSASPSNEQDPAVSGQDTLPAPDEAAPMDGVPSAEAAVVGAPPHPANATGDAIGTLDEVGVPEAILESRRDRLKRIARPLASFFGVQVVVQILVALSGILLIRHLSKTEYAYFTIANTMQGTIGVLGDSGISSALSAIGGVVWQDRTRFGELIQTALEFRRKFGLAVIALIGPLLLWLLYSNGSSIGYALVLSVIVLAGAGLSLTHGVLVMVPRLHSRISQLQNAELLLAGLRLALVGIASFLFLDAVVAASIFLVTLAVQNVLYRRWASADADLTASPNPQDRKKIWEIVRYQAPSSLFYCVQGQIYVLLISLFGTSNEVANVGALSRLTVFFSIIGALMANVILPRFARCQVREKVISMYLQIIAFHFLLSCVFMFAVIAFPTPFLWLLGSKYANLKTELAYLTFSSLVSVVTGVVYSLNGAKGWLKGAWLSIPLMLGGQALMIPFLNLGSIRDVVLLATVPSAVSSLPFIYRAYHSLRYFDENAQST